MLCISEILPSKSPIAWPQPSINIATARRWVLGLLDPRNRAESRPPSVGTFDRNLAKLDGAEGL